MVASPMRPIGEAPSTASKALFSDLVGPAFDLLPEPVRRLHLRGSASYSGQVVVRRGLGRLSRLCAWAARLPPAFDGLIRVDIEVDAGGERWTRRVRDHAMASRLWRGDGLLCEQLGLVRFGFRLNVTNGRLMWTVVRVRVLGLPLPSAWFSAVTAIESVEQERYCFDVQASLPIIGLLVQYRGWLDVD